MAAPARKRQRANTSGDTSNPLPTAPATDYKLLISTFDLPTTQSLLLSAAQHHPAVAQSILTKVAEIVAAERSRVIDFDHYSKSIWRALRDADRMSGSRAWEASFDVSSSIESAVQKMVEGAPARASLGTKKSALYTLRKICKTVALGRNDTCGHEVYNTLTGEQTLENGMLDIISGMSEEEKEVMRGDGEWVGKMEELEEMGDFDGIEDVLVEMGLGGSGDDDGDEAESEIESENESKSADNVDSDGGENIIGSRRCLFHANFGEKSDMRYRHVETPTSHFNVFEHPGWLNKVSPLRSACYRPRLRSKCHRTWQPIWQNFWYAEQKWNASTSGSLILTLRLRPLVKYIKA